jgi:hypothetical protein
MASFKCSSIRRGVFREEAKSSNAETSSKSRILVPLAEHSFNRQLDIITQVSKYIFQRIVNRRIACFLHRFGPRLAHFLLPISGKGHSDWGYAWILVAASILGCLLGTSMYKMFYKYDFQPQYLAVTILAVAVTVTAIIKGQKFPAVDKK